MTQSMHRCEAGRRGAAILLVAALLAGPALAGKDPGAAPRPGSLTGTVRRLEDGKAVAGARVIAHELASGSTFVSEPSGPKGRFELTGLPYGNYDVAVEQGDGLFVGHQIVTIPPTTRIEIDLRLQAYEEGAPDAGPNRRSLPGVESETAGIATVDRKLTGREFWRSPKGIAIIGAAAGTLLLLAASGSENDELVASPTAP